MNLTSTHVRYLLAIYRLAGAQDGVSSIEVAEHLGVKKASVSRMTPLLMEKGLVVKEKYSKLYLTDTGFLMAKHLFEQVDSLADLLQTRMQLTRETAWKSACAAVCELPLENS